MKRFITVLLAILLLFAVAGCNTAYRTLVLEMESSNESGSVKITQTIKWESEKKISSVAVEEVYSNADNAKKTYDFYTAYFGEHEDYELSDFNLKLNGNKVTYIQPLIPREAERTYVEVRDEHESNGWTVK